ncbi:MAG TPA: pyridoxamine 5'-phosphate oxidase [Gaiellaceae bacterium]|nr:pyridoxamine 5'-phosphate oxidase [Gaiellaceae bacterium]
MDERLLDPDPIAQVASWYREAQERGVAQPDAMTLATATPAGAPSARMVLLKGIDARGFAFFTNLESRKAAELAANPRAALVLYWQPLRRQVRAEGRVELLPEEESAAYFATRPRGSALAAWASPQSRPVGSREALERLYADVEERFAGAEVPLPSFWGGYLVVPDAVELWEGRDNRLHDRVRYERAAARWTLTRLAP